MSNIFITVITLDTLDNFLILGALEEALFYLIHQKRGSSVVSALASGARGPGFDPRHRRKKFGGMT